MNPEDLKIVESIEQLVGNDLQVVTYKWLAREHKISADCAKRCLEVFWGRHRDKVCSFHLISGWAKDESVYMLKLVDGDQLQGCLHQLDSASSHVYCVAPKTAMSVFSEVWTVNFEQTKMLHEESINKKENGGPRVIGHRNLDGKVGCAPGPENQLNSRPYRAGTALSGKMMREEKGIELGDQKPGLEANVLEVGNIKLESTGHVSEIQEGLRKHSVNERRTAAKRKDEERSIEDRITRAGSLKSEMEDSETDEMLLGQTSAKVPRLDFMDTDDEDDPHNRCETHPDSNAEEIQEPLPQEAAVPDQLREGAAQGTHQRRKKVLRVFIDDSGNEVTEEIWEDVQDEGSKNSDTPLAPKMTRTTKKTLLQEATHNPPAKAKSSNQRSILSFFGK